MKTRTLTRVAVVCALLTVVGAISLSQDSEYNKAKRSYDDYIKRPSLLMRTRGRIVLAQSQDVRALKILAANYPKPEDPKEQVRSLIVSTAANYMSGQEHVPIYQEWRNKNLLPHDAWLWYRTLLATQSYTGDEELLSTARDTKKDLFVRAAAMEAMAEQSSDNILPLMLELLEGAPKWKGNERMVMLETLARMYWSRAHELGTDNFRNVGLKFIPLMDEKATLERTRLVMARYFREIFPNSKLWVNSEAWLDRLLNPDKVVSESDSKYRQPPPPTKFIGVEAAGLRIVYVIDLSDSMLIPLSVKEREDIKKPPPPRGPVTGSGEGDGKGKAKEDKPEENAEEKPKDLADELPWDKIKNRFHAAREYLKLSLRSLQPHQQFCVIVFGTEAKTLNSTKGLVQVSQQSVAATIRELDNIKPGPAQPDRKHGTLMGFTNLHGGIHRAFKAKPGGLVKEGEYVDPTTFTHGADTIFILSDGDPTFDDWPNEDKRDPFDQAGDPESRTKHANMDILNFSGPYGYMYERSYLPDDVMRLNLFRKCEIHCIGIGEASYNLLAAIANAALGGQVKMVSGN